MRRGIGRGQVEKKHYEERGRRNNLPKRNIKL